MVILKKKKKQIVKLFLLLLKIQKDFQDETNTDAEKTIEPEIVERRKASNS